VTLETLETVVDKVWKKFKEIFHQLSESAFPAFPAFPRTREMTETGQIVQVLGEPGDEFEGLEGLDGLSPKRAAFVREFCVDHNGTQSAIRAGYSEATADEQASRLLANVKVRKAIAERMRVAAAAAGVDAALVIAELRDLAFSDPREIMHLIVRPCPRCWPAGLTLDDPNPLCDSPRLAMIDKAEINLGGCGGAGFQIVKLTDTRKLSRGAAKLLSSIRQAKDGSIELKMRDQDKALQLLGQVCGIFRDVREISGPNGGPLQLAPAVPPQTLTNQQLEDILRHRGMPLPQKTIEGEKAL
jgi:phage terminase small subunit